MNRVSGVRQVRGVHVQPVTADENSLPSDIESSSNTGIVDWNHFKLPASSFCDPYLAQNRTYL
jgi:hypothetical protein